MDLQNVQQQLKNQLASNGWLIKKEELASIPVHTLEVQYHPVQRAVMDILMKMMLISYERATIKDADILADILLVEPLFISDLTNKMLNFGMLERNEDGTIQLTEKGRLQKEHGIFEEQLPLQTEQLYYSPTHKHLLEGDLEAFAELVEIPSMFRYANEDVGEVDEQLLLTYLTELQPAALEDEPQSFVTELTQYTSIQVNDVPIFAFVCYEEKGDRFFAKVYNGLTNTWDEILEAIFAAQEQKLWAT